MENKTKTIIEWAEKGGYSGVPHQNQKGRWTGVRVLVDDDIAWLFLDPKFFQAIGRACGWGLTKCGHCGFVWVEHENLQACTKYKPIDGKDDWKNYALRFHEINLTQGMNFAIDYLYGLLPVETNI